ncbi:MAG: GrpB-like predicted nucleotidyltransferase (UPF0157 family) [Saprospiraceae bacterium]|jgi:GrpB-like predicted nucleotidyltransferase (UPF0157 family)
MKSNALLRYILYRDALKNNEFARVAYQNMKYELAEKTNQNKKEYAELKGLNFNYFIDKLIVSNE